MLLATVDDGTVTAYDLDSYDEVWSVDYEAPRQAALLPDDSAFVVNVADGVVALDPDDGTEQWHTEFDGGGGLGFRPVGEVDGIVGDTTFYDAADGREKQLSGLLTVQEMTDSDGEEIEETDPGDWGRPEYNTADSTEFMEYMEHTHEYRIEEEWAPDDDGVTLPGVDPGDWMDNPTGAIAGLVIIMGVVTVIAGIVTDFVPFLGD